MLAVPRHADARPRSPVDPDPPIGAADDPERRSRTAVSRPARCSAALPTAWSSGATQVIDEGINTLSAALDSQLASSGNRAERPVPLAEDASAAVMRALIGSARATDDVALLIAYREPAQLPD